MDCSTNNPRTLAFDAAFTLTFLKAADLSLNLFFLGLALTQCFVSVCQKLCYSWPQHLRLDLCNDGLSVSL